MNDEEQTQELVKFLRSRASFDIRYMVAADEIERLSHKVHELEIELREAEASIDIQRDFVEADIHKLRTENELLVKKNKRLEDAQPVAWLLKHADGFGGFDSFTFTTANEAAARAYIQKYQGYSISPLYTAPKGETE